MLQNINSLTKNWVCNYNPSTGRFLSEDPIGFSSGDVNLYRYVSNGPFNKNDPSGNFEVGISEFIRDVKRTIEIIKETDGFLEKVRKIGLCYFNPSKCGEDPAEEPFDPNDVDPDYNKNKNQCGTTL
jgi:RHS repeat-associated protein